MNDHYAETDNDRTFKLGLLTTLLSGKITTEFNYEKTRNVIWKIRKPINFRKMGQKTGQMTSSNYVMTLFDLGYF